LIDAKEIDKIVNKLKEEIEDGTVNTADYTFNVLFLVITQLEKEIVILKLEEGDRRQEITKLKRQIRRLEDQLILSQRPRVN
jgi:hypothetical protein